MRLNMPDLGSDVSKFGRDALVSKVCDMIIDLSMPSWEMERDAT